MSGGYIGRLAPSPTGALHLGNVRTFMIAYLRARSAGGKVIMRMEDLDHPKDKPGAAAQAIEDLKWLGFDWDEEYVQSTRRAIYREVTEALFASGAIYPCVCSRRDVESAQSAPHAGEQLFYPGTCRGRFASFSDAAEAKGATPVWRFRTAPGDKIAFTDRFAGRYEQDVAATRGDFPLARDEDGAGYTLAATVDDLLMGVTEVVRGDDLLPATPAQILLTNALRALEPARFGAAPEYFHVPLVVGPDGRRLAKRHGDTRVAFFRERGVPAARLLGYLASTCGWCEPGDSLTLADLLPRFTPATIPAENIQIRT